jgi:hypothetical protein
MAAVQFFYQFVGVGMPVHKKPVVNVAALAGQDGEFIKLFCHIGFFQCISMKRILCHDAVVYALKIKTAVCNVFVGHTAFATGAKRYVTQLEAVLGGNDTFEILVLVHDRFVPFPRVADDVFQAENLSLRRPFWNGLFYQWRDFVNVRTVEEIVVIPFKTRQLFPQHFLGFNEKSVLLVVVKERRFPLVLGNVPQRQETKAIEQRTCFLPTAAGSPSL